MPRRVDGAVPLVVTDYIPSARAFDVGEHVVLYPASWTFDADLGHVEPGSIGLGEILRF